MSHPIKLSANHRRVLAVRFSQLEERLIEIESLLNIGSEKTVFLRRVDKITSDEKERIYKLLNRTREEIRKLGESLSLDVSEESNRAHIQSLLALMWSDLQDTRPEKLTGYGNMSQEAFSLLTAPIQKLINLIQEMSLVLSGKAGVADEVQGCEDDPQST